MSDLDTMRWRLRAEAAEAEVVWHQQAVRGYASTLLEAEAERDALKATLKKVRTIAASCTPAWDTLLDKIVALIDAPSPNESP